jgi:hypothetical protein
MGSIVFLVLNKGKTKQLHELSEFNLSLFAQTHEKVRDQKDHHRINRWLQESSDASARHGWGVRACCTCLRPQYISDYEFPESGLEYLLPRRDSDAFSE